ncbi:DC-STAMP domain-containing protein 2 [Drosophila biarmipes]|uniref:DC-STAMP domain-containing protein 2 n=1 Tax=Drosophila biarmipes TaxID=125945 RepID=UPI0021CC88D9|nr:DC-STAMP domain-containing protein 2 [Drosophila biarmipes]
MVLIWYYKNPQKACIDLNGKWVFIVLLFLLLIILVQRRPARCIAALCFASLASYQFRAVIIALAFLLACTGPMKNIIHNICIMANSASCGQNVLIKALRLMQRIIYDPSHSVEESFQGTLAEVRLIMNKLDKLLLNLERPISQIHATYKTCADWLVLQKDQFDYKMGTPYHRCLRAGNLSITQCQREFGEKTKDCCNQKKFAWFCESLKNLKTFFDDNLQWSQVVIEEIFQRLQLCFMKIRNIFITTISFDHSLKLNSTSSLIANKDQIFEQDVTKNFELQRHKFFFVFLYLDLIIFILLLTVILKSVYFWFRYLASDSFENVYITKAFENYDDYQHETMGQRALPLSNCEENLYVKINSMRILPKEYSTVCRSWMFLMITGIQLFCICFVDYSLYNMLTLISFHGHMTGGLTPPAYQKIVVKGGGKIGDILRDLVHAFEPKGFKIDTQRCLPIPGKPKYPRYLWILLLYLLAWFMVFWEPYGLRQRHRIMVYFYPEESNRRVCDLHYTILKERKNVFKERCQQARLLNAFENNRTLLARCSWFDNLVKGCLIGCRRNFICKNCTICSKPLTKSDNVSCNSLNCRGIYCTMCFQECNNLCILCSSRYDSDILELG